VPDRRQLFTDRLELRAMHPGDAADLFPIFGDPDGYWYSPHDVHGGVEVTRAFCERAYSRWGTDNLSYWTARRREDGRVIGAGGAQKHRSGTCWNLFYRLDLAEQGHGYATELGHAGIAAAHEVDAALPVIAWIVPINEPSIRVARRLGLTDQGLRLDLNDGVERLVYADRDLAPDELRPL